MSKLFRILYSDVRVRILKELAVKDSCSASEVKSICNISAGTLAYHLGVLKELILKKENSYHIAAIGRRVHQIIKEVEQLQKEVEHHSKKRHSLACGQ